MTGSLFDSAIYRDLMLDRELAPLFTDTAELRAMLLVFGALARAQAAHGLIPETAAAAIQRAGLEIQIDPAALAAETGLSAVPVPALVTAFRHEMKAPEHAAFVHYGATSQDIMDSALALRLRQVLTIWDKRLVALIKSLGLLAEAQADTPMAGRTYGQVATPISFGAMVAGWGAPLLLLHAQLPNLRDQVLRVSLSGAAGTLSAMGEQASAIRSAFAEGLGLRDPGASWHSDRSGIAAFAAWITQLSTQLARIGEDLILLTQSGIGEVILPAAGGSSTMPQKRNPVMPSLLVALARQIGGLNHVMQSAALHRQQRDGSAWISEWMSLPQMCLGLGRGLQVAQALAEGITPDKAAMLAHIDDGTGLIFAEALSFHLARAMPRPEAQAAVKALCAQVAESGTPLQDLARANWPAQDLATVFDPARQLGLAPSEARAFATRTAALPL